MLKRLHAVAGATALATIATFWTATVLSELFGDAATVVAVKTAIPWGFLLLVPALMLAGGTGSALAAGRSGSKLSAKRRRMRLAAANGLLILIPSALFLAARARAGDFGGWFVTVQAIELSAGAVNIGLLGLNMRDGLAMAGAARARSKSPAS